MLVLRPTEITGEFLLQTPPLQQARNNLLRVLLRLLQA
jgi:hypothetical protein